jgi:NADH:ubiquinone oxidoreductase subunit K
MNFIDYMTGLHGYLIVSGVLWRKNSIGILLGIELILNAAGLNFIIFSKYRTATVDGQLVTLFIILIAAAEAAVALAIILRFYRLRETIDAGDANLLRN